MTSSSPMYVKIKVHDKRDPSNEIVQLRRLSINNKVWHSWTSLLTRLGYSSSDCTVEWRSDETNEIIATFKDFVKLMKTKKISRIHLILTPAQAAPTPSSVPLSDNSNESLLDAMASELSPFQVEELKTHLDRIETKLDILLKVCQPSEANDFVVIERQDNSNEIKVEMKASSEDLKRLRSATEQVEIDQKETLEFLNSLGYTNSCLNAALLYQNAYDLKKTIIALSRLSRRTERVQVEGD